MREKREELDKQIKSLEQNNAGIAQPSKSDGNPVTSTVNGKQPMPPAKNGEPETNDAIKITPTPVPTTAPAPIQTNSNQNLTNLSENVLENVPDAGGKPSIDLTDQSQSLILLLFDRTVKDEKAKEAVIDVEAARADKLLGATSTSSGTTSLVSKGGIPLIFSLATEYGAATSSVNGTSTTFQFNPVGLSDFLTGSKPAGNTDSPCKSSDGGFRKHFCRTSFGLTFDISRGVETPTFTGSGKQLSELSFRYEFLHKREPNALEFKAATDTLLNNVLLPVSSAQFTALNALLTNDNQGFKNPALQNWLDETNAKLDAVQLQFANNGKANDDSVKAANIQKIQAVITEQLADFPTDEVKKDVDVTGAITKFSNADALYREAKKEYLKKLITKSLLTFEYINKRALNSPDSSNVKFIYGKGLSNGIDFTFNGSFTAFHSRPAVSPTMTAEQVAKFKRLRDFSFAAEMDVPLFGISGLNSSTFSLAAKYQRINTDAFVFNNVIFDDIKGDVWIGQAKLNLGLGKSGFFLPLSFTYANRAELNKEKKSQGHLGFTFDVSPLIERYLSGMFQR